MSSTLSTKSPMHTSDQRSGALPIPFVRRSTIRGAPPVSRIALFLAVAGLTIVPAIAGAAPPSLTVVGTQITIHQSGKTVTFTETLRLRSRLVGGNAVTCTLISGKSIYRCHALYTFSRGTVIASGKVDKANPNNHLFISGGTGVYDGAKGNLALHDIGKTNRTRETFNFTS
jgi:hypothetical protein